MKDTAKAVGHPGRQPPDNDKFAKTFFGERVQTTISRNVRAAAEQLRRIEADPILRPPDPMRFNPRFTGDALRSRAVVSFERVRRCYGSRTVLREATAEVRPGARIMLVGPNGAGKTTLLNLLTGRPGFAVTRCLVPESRDATLTREAEEALWQSVFTAQPERRREFEPSSKRRKRRAAPWPSATG
jgi:ATPase subunit of ABC transporter with duplicated ATPase domains